MQIQILLLSIRKTGLSSFHIYGQHKRGLLKKIRRPLFLPRSEGTEDQIFSNFVHRRCMQILRGITGNSSVFLLPLKKLFAMPTSVELVLIPIQDDYKVYVKDFVWKRRNSGSGNPANAGIYLYLGECHRVKAFLPEETRKVFSSTGHIMLIIKIMQSNRSYYAANV